MDLELILLGQIPEALFFSLFIIFTKQLKEKRILFTILMIVEYMFLKQCFVFDSWFQILYTILIMLTLKVIYKEKSQFTDLFIILASYLVLILTSIIIFIFLKNYMILATIINRIIMFLFLLIFKNKLNKLQKLYKKYWNNNTNKKMKRTTFRSLNVIILNTIFIIINLGMMYMIYLRK